MEHYTAMKNSKAQLPTITGTELTDIALHEVIRQAVRSRRLHLQEAETGKTNQQREFSLGTGDKGREDACLGREGTREPAGGLFIRAQETTSPRAKIIACFYKVLLGYGHTHSFTFIHNCIQMPIAELNGYSRVCIAQKPKIRTVWPCTEEVPQSVPYVNLSDDLRDVHIGKSSSTSLTRHLCTVLYFNYILGWHCSTEG